MTTITGNWLVEAVWRLH